MLFLRLPICWPCMQQVADPVTLGAPVNDEMSRIFFFCEML